MSFCLKIEKNLASMNDLESNRAKFRWPEPRKFAEKGEGEIKISSDEARIFRILHIENVASIVRYGLVSRNYFPYPKYVEIGANKLIKKRKETKIPVYPFGTLSDYVSFYFTPSSPMLHNVLNGINVSKRRSANKIIFVESSLFELERANLDYVYSDRHILSSEKVNFLDCLEAV